MGLFLKSYNLSQEQPVIDTAKISGFQLINNFFFIWTAAQNKQQNKFKCKYFISPDV